ncbi:MAG: DUF2188 domain-containing protein [Candidatus Gracilibacteria bacterium]|nr:DUF2188 domain-containing protein [Candidatus Gracilibacteria bacterium]
MTKKLAQWVVRTPEAWGVRKEGSSRLTKKLETQAKAIEIARQIAINQGAELIIQGRDRKIRERDSHGNDSYPPKG